MIAWCAKVAEQHSSLEGGRDEDRSRWLQPASGAEAALQLAVRECVGENQPVFSALLARVAKGESWTVRVQTLQTLGLEALKRFADPKALVGLADLARNSV